MDHHDKKLKKKKFAIGIFLMLLIIESGIAVAAALLYFRHTSVKGIEKIEKYTKNYSFTMADAFADVAELSYKANDYNTLKALFHQEIRENTIDEAFFALNDGRLIAHSSREKEKELAGNIATDEFAYNIDLILRPAKRNLSTIQFTSYNVMGKSIPFPREYRELLKEHIYDEIELLGWLVSKAVYHKKTAIGTINFIIYKDRIYDYINTQINETKKIYAFAQVLAFAVSLVVSIVVVLRYRSIQNKTYALTREKVEKGRRDIPEVIELVPDREITLTAVKGAEGDEEYITLNLTDDLDEGKFQIEVVDDDMLDDFGDLNEDGPMDEYKSGLVLQEISAPSSFGGERLINTRQIVQDAIPIEKKRH